jgi:hypothetical protein
VNFTDNFWLKYPAIAVIKSWHYFNRLKPFTYRPPSKHSPKILTILLVCILVSMVMLFF